MEEQNSDFGFSPPIHTNSFAIPNERKLLFTYNVYKPSIETTRLLSEKGRTIFSEIFIEDAKLGTLSDLCVRSLAKAYGPTESILVRDNPLKQRIHYDSLDVDLPLEKCYNITDEKYWRRVVLAKSDRKDLALKQSYDWKNLGISLKFVEIVEACSAEYWPEEEMKNLAIKIKEFVTELHIRKLKSLQERSFEEYFQLSDSDEEEDDESIELSDTSESSSFVESEDEPIELFKEVHEGEEPVEKTEDELELERQEVKKRRSLKYAEWRRLKDAKKMAHEEKKKRRDRLEAKREAERQLLLEQSMPKKKVRKPKPKGIFDIVVEEEEDDGEEDKLDRRNMEKLLRRKRDYNYPPEHCHHIDLSFIRFFDNLTSYILEFQGPEMELDYHERHFNFSYKDMETLAVGLRSLESLKYFGLCNSRMDAVKLSILVKSLKNLESLESVDLRNDQLQNDCCHSLNELFQNTTSIKSLELKGNFLSTAAMQSLADAIKVYQGRLKYLGLAGNPLQYDGLHVLASAIIGTQQITHLDLTGIDIDQEGIVCCIANKLLRQHTILKQMDLIAIPISWSASSELIKALETNRSICYMDVRGCDLDSDSEFEIEVILRRNRFIEDNPYIGDDTKTDDEIAAFVNRIKNPVLLEALNCVEQRASCIEPCHGNYSIQSSLDSLRTFSKVRLSSATLMSVDKSITSDPRKSSELSANRFSKTSVKPVQPPFIYQPNEFTEAEFKKHVYLPGPDERYYFFQKKKRKH